MIIYKITNLINNKIYIGQKTDLNNLEELIKSNYYGSSKYLSEDIKEFGKNNFKREVIDYSDDKYNLSDKEEYWIEFYEATNPDIGYNKAKKIGKFFHTGCKHTQDAKDIMRQKKLGSIPWNKGLKGYKQRNKSKKYEYTEESLNRIRVAHLGKDPWNKGLHWNKSVTEKMSIAKNHLKKVVIKKDLLGNIIDEYESIRAAAIKNNTYPACITACCNNVRKTAGSFMWEFKNK